MEGHGGYIFYKRFIEVKSTVKTESGHGIEVLDSTNQLNKLGKCQNAIFISIHCLDHVLELSFSGAQSYRPHGSTQLTGTDDIENVQIEDMHVHVQISS